MFESQSNQEQTDNETQKIHTEQSNDVINHQTNLDSSDLSQNKNDIFKIKINRTMSNLTVYDKTSKFDFSDSDAQLYKSNQVIHKHLSDQIISEIKNDKKQLKTTNLKNKMKLQKTNQMSIGRTINRNNFQKVSIYGNKIHIGLGFPLKTPIIINKESEIIEKSDKKFESLEKLIKKLKNESKILNTKQTVSQNDKSIEKVDLNVQKITIQDINYVTNEIDDTKKQFIEMEANILNDFSSINSSIDKLLEDRKEMQKQHRIWLENMKKQICKTKKRDKLH